MTQKFFVYFEQTQRVPRINTPVVVFIPGGGFLAGDSSGDGMYDCSKLASRTNTIYVVLQYRLGAFGFLAAPEINPENDDVWNSIHITKITFQ